MSSFALTMFSGYMMGYCIDGIYSRRPHSLANWDVSG